MGRYRIGLITFATGKYVRYVPGFVETALLFFCPDDLLTIYVFTNSDQYLGQYAIKVPCEHEPWPLSTLCRYHKLQKATCFENEDLLYMLDVDLLFSYRIGQEIIPPKTLGLTVVHHPGFYHVPGAPWVKELFDKRLPKGTPYCAGGFVGGWRGPFMEAVGAIVEMADEDLAKGHIAEWHDESYLNKYVFEHPAHFLSPAYCFDHGFRTWGPYYPTLPILGRQARVTLLHKDHKEMRKERPDES